MTASSATAGNSSAAQSRHGSSGITSAKEISSCRATTRPTTTRFADPARFDITRGGAGHLTFGHGPRYCVGAPLARIELQAVFSQLVPRFPTMHLAVPLDEVAVRRDTLTGGLAELPVTW